MAGFDVGISGSNHLQNSTHSPVFDTGFLNVLDGGEPWRGFAKGWRKIMATIRQIGFFRDEQYAFAAHQLIRSHLALRKWSKKALS